MVPAIVVVTALGSVPCPYPFPRVTKIETEEDLRDLWVVLRGLLRDCAAADRCRAFAVEFHIEPCDHEVP